MMATYQRGIVGEDLVDGLVEAAAALLGQCGRREDEKRGERAEDTCQHGKLLWAAHQGTMVQGRGATWMRFAAVEPNMRAANRPCPSRPTTICVAPQSLAMFSRTSAEWP